MTEPDRIARARAGENFPVASRLIAPALRPVVLAFYAVVRGADDVADDPAAAAEAKLARLDAIDAVLAGAAPPGGDRLLADAARLHGLCLRRAIPIDHARRMLQAFRADADNRPCRSWSDLLAYCRFSAAPVGRFLLDLHGEDRASWPASDALCAALQILNHLQDARDDRTKLGRAYVPTDWLAAAGLATDALAGAATPPALRAVFDQLLDGVDRLLATAAPLGSALADRRLAAEAAGILAIARALARRLRGGDPLAGRVALGKAAKAVVFARAALAERLRRGAARDGGPSSFALAILLMPSARRGALADLYRFARAVDDVADGPAPAEAKRVAFVAWHAEIDRPADADIDPALPAADIARYGLPVAELHALVDGMAMDADGPIRAPERATLTLYCRRVAGSVGLLALPIFGCDGAPERRFAVALGEALQLINILRDVDEDAARGRLYLAREWLTQAGLDPAAAPAELIADARFALARERLVAEARAAMTAADAALAGCDRRALVTALTMMAVYRRLLALLARPRPPGARPPRMGWVRQLAAAIETRLRSQVHR